MIQEIQALSPSRLAWRLFLKNRTAVAGLTAVICFFLVAVLGLLIPGLIGGSVIFETIFAWPGIGRLGYEAILGRDYPVVIALNFIAALLTLTGTLLSDLLYMLVDPRIRL